MKKPKQTVKITSWSYDEGDDRSYGSLLFTANTSCGEVVWQSEINSDSTHENSSDSSENTHELDLDGHPWHSNAGGMLEGDAKAVVRKALTTWCKVKKSGRGR